MKKNTTKNLPKFSNILLITALVLSVATIVFYTLFVFEILPSNLNASFNFIVGYIIVAICLGLYVLLLFVEKQNKLMMPEWFKILFYIALFAFTNVYYFFGFYETLIGLIVFYVYLGFLISIIALSIFFNVNKGENSTVKTSGKFVGLTTFAYSLSFGAVLQTIISIVKILLKKTDILSSLTMFAIEMGIIILISLIMSISYCTSLNKNKKFINKCLIKIM